MSRCVGRGPGALLCLATVLIYWTLLHSERKMNVEKFFEETGGFGNFQKLQYSLLSLCGLFSAFSTMSYVFVTAVPDHWCASPVEFMNLSVEERKALTIPVKSSKEYSQCMMFDWSRMNNSNSGHATVSHDMLGYSVNVSSLPVKKCSSWEYDRSVYTNTVVMEWDLVCGHEWIVASIGASMGIGKLVFAFVAGVLSDRFGRKRTMVGFLLMQCLSGVLTAVSVSPTMLIISYALLGGASMGKYTTAFVLGLELVGVQYRSVAGLGINTAYSIGYLVVALVAYFVRDWVTLQLSLHLPIIAFVALSAWLTPESPRWLLQRHRVDDAVVVLKRIARVNGLEWNAEMDPAMVTCDQEEKQIVNRTTTLIISLLKSRTMILFTVVNAMMWFCATLLFNGLSYNTSNLAGDPYSNFAISGAVEIPALLCTYVLLKSRLGRRGTTLLTLMTSAAFLLTTMPVTEEFGWIVTSLAMCGKLTSTSYFATIYFYTPEMYPTSFRSVAMSTASSVGRLGTIVAPYIVITGQVYFRELPLMIFGLVSIAVAGATCLLPETGPTSLPDTLDECKNLKRHRISCCRKIRREPSSADELNTLEVGVDHLTTNV